jgi:CBS domain-containing protein
MRSLVKDLMTTPVVTVGPPTPFKEIVARLTTHRVSAVPVVNDAGLVLGVVSEADLLLKRNTPTPTPTSRWSGPSGGGPSTTRRPRRWPATS